MTPEERLARKRESRRKWWHKNKESQLAYTKQKYNEKYKGDTLTIRRWTLAKRYRMTLQDFARLYELQGGRCAICGTPQAEMTKHGLVVDHDHTTSRVRGLLCHRCNVGIGGLRDDIDIMLAAIEYIKKWRGARA